MTVRILGIETSCDETAAAVVADGWRVESNIIASQHDLHRRYQGVVPEIASRAHLERINPVIDEALRAASAAWPDLDAIAVGNRPGLIGSLMVGVSAAKAVAWATRKPLIAVNHVQAHLYSATMSWPGRALGLSEENLYPALGLVVSGGHTSLFALHSPAELTLLGKTIDDAVGEAYDKAAVILQLGYPGGPLLDELAQTGDPRRFHLPRSLLAPDSLDFSYSGLKTALLYQVRGLPQGRGHDATFSKSAADLSSSDRADLAAAFQNAAIDTLFLKLDRALDHLATQARPSRSILIGGGVSANSLLRQRAAELAQQRNLEVLLPPMPLCLDNAAMIAGFAFHRFQSRSFDDLHLPAIATTLR